MKFSRRSSSPNADVGEPDHTIGPAERPLKVFVSSAMDEAMEPIREYVSKTLENIEFVEPWVFENVPPSSEPVRSGYLRQVGESDFLIWLMGSATTAAVRDEVLKARATSVRILVIRTSTEADEATEQLLESLRSTVRYVTATDMGVIGRHVRLAISDELIRAFRHGFPTAVANETLANLHRRSVGECLARWEAAGLSRVLATELAENSTIGSEGLNAGPTASEPVVVLTGPVGAGKTILAHRYFQSALIARIEDPEAPVPAMLHARDAIDGIDEAISGRFADLTREPNWIADVAIDGLDELGVIGAAKLLEDARAFVYSRPGSLVLLTSRPLADLEGSSNSREIPHLEFEVARDLALKSSGLPELPGVLHVNAEARALMGLPLFALLIGKWYSQHSAELVPSPLELVDFLGREACRGLTDLTKSALRRLAVLQVENELAPVSSFGTIDEPTKTLLANSGFVKAEEESLELILPAMAQWFASQALLHDPPSLDGVVSVPSNLELWRYPAALAISVADDQQTARLVKGIIGTSPGFTMRVLREAFKIRRPTMPQAPAPEVAAKKLHESMDLITHGLPELSHELGFSNAQGHAGPVVVNSDGHLEARFLKHGTPVGQGMTLSEFRSNGPRESFVYETHSMPEQASNWALRWARSSYEGALERKLRDRWFLSVHSEFVLKEVAWSLLADLRFVGRYSADSVSIPEALEVLKKRWGDDSADLQVLMGANTIKATNILGVLLRLQGVGISELRSPIPPPDRLGESSHLADCYTEDALVRCARTIYENAIGIYVASVDEHLHELKRELSLYALLPAKVDLRVQKESAFEMSHIALTYSFDPLPDGSKTEIHCQLDTERRHPDWRSGNDIYWSELKRLRPRTYRQIAPYAGSKVFTPWYKHAATELAYSWIWSDLKVLGLATSLYSPLQ